MKAIFPNTKLLQPMPNASSVHPNISGNVNSAPSFTPNDNASTQNTSLTPNNPNTIQPIEVKNGSNWIFYFAGLIIILLMIILYRKIKRK
jgi:hypothetical protein